MSFGGIRLGLIGPLPPPEGGMANQTQQLADLLRREGAEVTLVRVNEPYRPRWIERIRVVRAVFRLLPYVLRLWKTAGQVDLFHVMANSGLSWHLHAVPAMWIARIRGIPAVVNYRGGEAEPFLERSGALVRNAMQRADAFVVPSGFLHGVFARQGIHSEVVPNIVDLQHFRASGTKDGSQGPHLVVARNLEPIYDIPTALRAFALVRRVVHEARLTVAGTGPEQSALAALAKELGILDATCFSGRLDRDEMAVLYRSATISLNPSRVDNMPNSVLEAMASGVPVVSTAVGGVPFIVRDGETGLLVAPGDSTAMSEAVVRLLRDPELSARVRKDALNSVQQYAWSKVRDQWLAVYRAVLGNSSMGVRQT